MGELSDSLRERNAGVAQAVKVGAFAGFVALMEDLAQFAVEARSINLDDLDCRCARHG